PWQKPYATPLHHGDEDLSEEQATTSSACSPGSSAWPPGLLPVELVPADPSSRRGRTPTSSLTFPAATAPLAVSQCPPEHPRAGLSLRRRDGQTPVLAGTERYTDRPTSLDDAAQHAKAPFAGESRSGHARVREQSGMCPFWRASPSSRQAAPRH